MKRLQAAGLTGFTALAVFAALVISGGARPSAPHVLAAGGPPPTSATLSFDFSKSNNQPCSATLTVNCVTGFTLELRQGPVVLGTPVTVLLPAIMSTTGPTSFPCTNCWVIPGLGQYEVCAMANYKDASGAARIGPSGCVSVLNAPDIPVVTVE